MKLYIYVTKFDKYVVISDTNFISSYYGSTINEAVDKYLKSSRCISQDIYWLDFVTKNKPILEIDSEIHPEYFI